MRSGIRAENSWKRKFLLVIGLDIKIVMHFHEKRAPPTVDRFFTFFWKKRFFNKPYSQDLTRYKFYIIGRRPSAAGQQCSFALEVVIQIIESVFGSTYTSIHVLQMSVIFELMWKKNL